MDSIALTIFAMICVAYVLLALVLYFMQSRFVYDPVREVVYTPDELGLEFEDVYFKTGDRVNLHGWFIPALGADFTVLFCHGNGGNIMFYLDTVNLLNSLGLNCFVFDYRGYGQSRGRPNEDGTYLDVRAAFRWLTRTKAVPSNRIVIFGWSLGGSIAAYLASKVRPAGLVIDGAFTSYPDIGSKFYPYMPVRWFAKFKYPTIDFVRKVKCPVLIFHSRNDEVIPFEFGLRLYDAAKEPKEFVELYGAHNDAFLTSADVYKRAWLKWLQFLRDSFANTLHSQKSV